jgi:hypothetical protein
MAKPDRRLRVFQITGRIILALGSVGIFLYAVGVARNLVRMLSGLPSFLSLVSLIVLGIAELAWIIVVSEIRLPNDFGRTRSRLLRFLAGEAVALAVVLIIPAVVLSVASGLPLRQVLVPLEHFLLPAAVVVAVVALLLSRR